MTGARPLGGASPSRPLMMRAWIDCPLGRVDVASAGTGFPGGPDIRQVPSSECVHRDHGDRELVEDLRDRLPGGQPRQPFGIERYDYRVTGVHIRVRGTEQPATLVRCDAAVGAHDVNLALVGERGHATALRNV